MSPSGSITHSEEDFGGLTITLNDCLTTLSDLVVVLEGLSFEVSSETGVSHESLIQESVQSKLDFALKVVPKPKTVGDLDVIFESLDALCHLEEVIEDSERVTELLKTLKLEPTDVLGDFLKYFRRRKDYKKSTADQTPGDKSPLTEEEEKAMTELLNLAIKGRKFGFNDSDFYTDSDDN